jgi:meiosis-specific protein HOP1
VNVGIQSIVAYLPSTEDNDAAFTGTTTGASAPSLTPLQEANHRAQQVELQTKDASERNVVWDVEHGLGDADAEGEDDPDYVDGVFVGGSKVNDSGVEILVPIGIRNEEGVIVPIKFSERGVGTDENVMMQMERKAGSGERGMRVDMDVDDTSEEHFGGFSERVPLHAGELVRSSISH